jgi:hypothetical protein
MWKTAAVTIMLMLPIGAWAQDSLPDPAVTPGATNPEVTQASIAWTICRRGYARLIRPPRRYTSGLKRRQLRAAAYADQRMRNYEEDHLIPLELGGAPADPRNLWPQPRLGVDGWDADRKDELEGVLNRMVCHGGLPLRQAQEDIAHGWTGAYRTFIPAGRSP